MANPLELHNDYTYGLVLSESLNAGKHIQWEAKVSHWQKLVLFSQQLREIYPNK